MSTPLAFGSTRRAHLEVVVVLFVALLLYLPFLAVQYNPNGINEAIAVEDGGRALVSPNHMVYRPAGATGWHFARAVGYRGRALHVLQVLSAVAGSVAVTLAFAAFRRLTGHSGAAAVAAVWLATSSYFWSSSVDAFYIAPAAALAAASLMVVSGTDVGWKGAVAAGVWTALSILVWQACVFLVPAIALGLYRAGAARPTWTRLRWTALFVAVALGIAGMVYAGVGALLLGHRSPQALISWLSRYAGADLPQWGAWGFDRLPALLDSAVSSVLPLTRMGGVVGLLRRGGGSEALVPWIALTAAIALAAVTGWTVFRRVGLRPRLAAIAWPAFGYAMFLPFLAWWDPFEPKWFVVPNLFLAALLACAWAASPRPRITLSAVAVCVLVLGAATFSIRIWPASSGPSVEQQRADCVASHLQPDDVFFALDWKWIAHLRYFHQLRVVSVIGMSAQSEDPERLIASLDRQVEAARKRGGMAFVVDPASYPPAHLRWLESQTGLGPGHLERWLTTPAFECEGARLSQVEGFR